MVTASVKLSRVTVSVVNRSALARGRVRVLRIVGPAWPVGRIGELGALLVCVLRMGGSRGLLGATEALGLGPGLGPGPGPGAGALGLLGLGAGAGSLVRVVPRVRFLSLAATAQALLLPLLRVILPSLRSPRVMSGLLRKL